METKGWLGTAILSKIVPIEISYHIFTDIIELAMYIYNSWCNHFRSNCISQTYIFVWPISIFLLKPFCNAFFLHASVRIYWCLCRLNLLPNYMVHRCFPYMNRLNWIWRYLLFMDHELDKFIYSCYIFM